MINHKHKSALEKTRPTVAMNSAIRNWITEGNNFFDHGNFQNALPCYDKVIEKDPENLTAWLNKGASLSELGRFEEALVCYDKVLDINPQEIDTWFSKGNSLFNLGRLKEAVGCYDKALEIDPQNFIVLTNKFEALLKLELPEAESVLHKLEHVRERQTKILIKKGSKLLNSSKFEAAITCFKDAAELDPNQTREWLNKWFESDVNCNKILEAANPKVREPIQNVLHLARGLKNYPKTSLKIIQLASLFSINEKVTVENLQNEVAPLIEIFKCEFVRNYTNDDYSEKCFDEILKILSKALNINVEQNKQLSNYLSDFWTRLTDIDDSLTPMTTLAAKLQMKENRSDAESLVMFHLYCYTFLIQYETLFLDVIKNLFAFTVTSKDKNQNVLNIFENYSCSKTDELFNIRRGFKQLYHIEPVFLDSLRAQEKIDFRNAIAHGQAVFVPEKMQITFKCEKYDRQAKIVTHKTITLSLRDFVQKWLDVVDVIDSFRYISMIINAEKLLIFAKSMQS